jgi:selenocysteine lyase/cysteine desulfurase
VAKLVALLGLDRRAGPRPLVLVGPHEHHSNLLPWRESAAEVVAVGEDASGRVDLAELEALLAANAGRPLVGAFSAASNVTGILAPADAVATLLHRHGVLSLWDYSAAAPYLPIRMAASRPGAGDHQDAVVFSPHKFVGGPQTPGTDLIIEREQRFLHRALERWRANPNLELLGDLEAPRLPIVSFRVRHGGRLLHHELVVALLNDLFGIQARGGCSCAGPYGHRLLGIDPDRSRALSEQAGRGYLGIKPGWARLSFNYFITDATCDYLVEAVDLLASHGHRLLGNYRFDPRSGQWRHHRAPPDPEPSLHDLLDGVGGSRTGPGSGEEVLAGQLAQARAVLAAAPAGSPGSRPPALPPELERLRDFHLTG